MTDFKAISGKRIRFLTSDLTMSTATEGELFYSDSGKKFKVGVFVQAWSSATNLPNATGGARGLGTLTAGLVTAGRVSGTGVAETYEYDGTDWTAGGDVNNARAYHAAMGTQTAGLICGGNPVMAHSEEYDGSSWTEGSNLNDARQYMASAGTQTAGLESMGGNAVGATTGNTEEYNGTSWTEVTDNPTARTVDTT